MTLVGDIDIPFISELSPDNITNSSKSKKYLNRESKLNENLPDLNGISMSGMIVEYNNIDPDIIIENIASLGYRSAAYNMIDFVGVRGYIAANSFKSPRTADNINARDYTLDGFFLPSSRYESAYRINTDTIDNDFNIRFPPTYILPYNYTGVKVKTPWNTLFLDDLADINCSDGSMKVYRPFSFFDETNYNTTTGDIEFLEEAHGCVVFSLDAQTETVQWTQIVGGEIPKSRYKLVVRLKDTNVTDDISITVSGSVSGSLIDETFTTGDTSWVILETSEFQAITDETLTFSITKLTADVNDIIIDYAFVYPTIITKLCFDVDSDDLCGNVKVYDTYGSSDSNDWVQIHNYSHHFDDTSDIIIENSFFRWKLDLSSLWQYTGQLTNLINDKVGQLYPYAFKDDSIRYKINEIRPDYVELELYMKTGDDESLSVGDTEITKVVFLPYMIKFECNRFGSFKNDWFVDIAFDNWITTYIPSSPTTMISPSSSASTSVSSSNGISLNIYDDSIIGLSVGKNTSSAFNNDGSILIFDSVQTGNYEFSLFTISDYIGNEYMFREGSEFEVYNNDGNITYTNTVLGPIDFFNADYSSSTFATYYGGYNNILTLRFGAGMTNKLRLRSYYVEDVEFKVDTTVALTTAESPLRKTGVIFAYQDDNNYYRLNIVYASDTLCTIELIKRIGGVETTLATQSGIYAPISDYDSMPFTENYYTIDVDFEPGTIEYWIYQSGTARSVALYHNSVSDSSLSDGYIGVVAYSQNANSNIAKPITFKNLVITSATDPLSHGIQVNTVIDDLTWDNKTNEYYVDTLDSGAIGSWSFGYIENCARVNSLNLTEVIKLKNCSLGSGNYSIQTRILSTSSVDRKAGFVFCANSSVQLTFYGVCIEMDASGNTYCLLEKYNTATDTYGLYGDDGYGEYGYGGDSSLVTLNQSDHTFTVNQWVNIECEFNRITRSFDVYVWNIDTTKPSTPTFSYVGDETYDWGNVGLYSTLSASGTNRSEFRNLVVTDTEEENAYSHSFICMGGVNHGRIFDYDTDTYRCDHFYTLMGTYLGLGRYNLIVRAKSTNGTDVVGVKYINATDNTSLDALSSDKYFIPNLTTSYTNFNKILEIGSGDNLKLGKIYLYTASSSNTADLTFVDFIAMIPTTMISGGSYMYPYDMNFLSYNDEQMIREVEYKDYGMKLIGRFDTNYSTI